jgi:P-type conjugative transfer protein TrbJ
MKRHHKRLLIVASLAVLIVPAAAFADIVFDPTNFIEEVQQVEQDVELVGQFQQEVQNGAAMLQSWGYSQLGGIMQSMDVWQQALAATTYSSTDPNSTLSGEYPLDLSSYASTTDTAYQSMQSHWDQEARSILIENRTVQNDTYLDLQPTADRIQAYVDQSNSAPGATAAVQASNEEIASLIAQLQSLQAQEITDARAEVERDAREQAEEAYAEQQRQAVRGDWNNPPPPTTPVDNAFPLANQ